MKTIIYDPRIGGTATYWDMKPTEQKYIIEQLDRIMIEYAERSISTDAKDKIFTQYMTDPDRDLGRSPKHNKTNTPMSVIGGILSNVRLGNTRNLTDRACEKIQIIFDCLERAQAAGFINPIKIESIRWQQMGQAGELTPFDELFSE